MTFRVLCDIFNTRVFTMKKSKKIFSFFDVAVIVIICSFIMCFLGATIVYKRLGGIDYSLLSNDEDMKRFVGAYNELIDNYYDSLDKKTLIDGAVSGMYEVTGDPYTTYLDYNTSEALDDSLDGEYTGIGISVSSLNGAVVIVNVFKDSPAEKAGLVKGDVIKKVDGEAVTSDNSGEVIGKIKTAKKVALTVESAGSEKTLEIETTTMLVPVVNSQVFERNGKKIGYIALTVFNDTADIQFTNALTELEKSGIESLIVDLRSNTGGYLQITENIIEMFLEKDKVMYSLENKSSSTVIKDDTSEHREYPIDVLINKNSASAAEIMAAALKYSYGAKLVGIESYGKGKVQERSNLEDGSSLKYTTAKWLTPNGDCIDGIGLQPDIEILQSEDHDYNDIYTDTQFMKALEDLAA